MSTATFVRTRVRSPRAATGLLVGDVLAVYAFVLVGTLDHGFAIDPVRMTLTALPFLIGWLVLAIPLGLYGTYAADLPWTAVATLGTWAVAVVIGGFLRETVYFPGASPTSFLLASLVFGGLIVVGWRTAAALVMVKKAKAVS